MEREDFLILKEVIREAEDLEFSSSETNHPTEVSYLNVRDLTSEQTETIKSSCKRLRRVEFWCN